MKMHEFCSFLERNAHRILKASFLEGSCAFPSPPKRSCNFISTFRIRKSLHKNPDFFNCFIILMFCFTLALRSSALAFSDMLLWMLVCCSPCLCLDVILSGTRAEIYPSQICSWLPVLLFVMS